MEHLQPHLETAIMSKDEARMRIEEVRQRVAAVGGNDIEFSLLNEIRSKLDKDEISPEKAVEEANEVYSRKQSYH